MKYTDLIGSFIYLVSGVFVWYQVYRIVREQGKRIQQLERIINEQNQRHVGFLAIFEMLLRKLNETTKHN